MQLIYWDGTSILASWAGEPVWQMYVCYFTPRYSRTKCIVKVTPEGLVIHQ